MTSSRYITHAGNPRRSMRLDEAKDTISATLNTTVSHALQANQKQPGPSTSIYIGIPGIALMAHDLSKHATNVLPSGLVPGSLATTGDQELLSALKVLIRKGAAAPSPSPSRCSFLETDVGVATLVLLRIIDTKSESPFLAHWEACVQLLRSGVSRATDVEEYYNDACEVLYGRAGLLYALLRIRTALAYNEGTAAATTAPGQPADPRVAIFKVLGELVGDEGLRSVVKAIVEIGRLGATAYAKQLDSEKVKLATPPLMWSWHGKMYLGAAHGVAGILHMLWNCPPRILEPYVSDMVATLEWLLDCQDSTGNWPSKAPNGLNDPHETSDVIQWCHGATGVVVFLCTTLRHDLDGIKLNHELRQRLVTAVYESARLIYRRGLLRKGLGICHGVAGSVYALLAASRVLDDNHSGDAEDKKWEYLLRAVHLARMGTDCEELTETGQMKVPDRPWSLYEGAAGMCCAWAEVLSRLEGSRVSGIPGFDDI